MTKKDRTVAALQYIDSTEINRRKYLKNKFYVKKSTWFIYFSYQRTMEILTPNFKLIDYMYNFYEMKTLLRNDTTYALPKKHRKLITLISYYYHQKNHESFISLDEEFLNKAKILFTGK